jgi:thioredoxin-like negative regulator of GroEL
MPKKPRRKCLAFQAVREAEVGNASGARQAVARALALAPGRDVKVLSALALIRTGEFSQSKTILETRKKSRRD